MTRSCYAPTFVAPMLGALATPDPSASPRRLSTIDGHSGLGAWTLILSIICALTPLRAVAQIPRTTANQGLAAHYGWQDPDGFPDGLNSISFATANADTTLAAGKRVYNKLGDPSVDFNLPAYNANYTVTFKLIATTPTLGSGQNSTINAYLTTEYSINSGTSWTSVGGTSQVTASRSTPGVTTTTQVFTVTLNFSGGAPDWIRLILRGTASGNASGGQVKVQSYASSGWSSDPYAVAWSSPVNGVAVRPELPERQHFAATSGSQRFFVKNLETVSATFTLAPACTGTASGCAVSPTTLSSIPPGESRVATLTYSVGAGGTTGTGMVKAFDNTFRDSASIAVTVNSTPAPGPVVSVVDVNPGTTLRRDLCVTIAAGAGSAFECGDLRVVHPLPAIKTLNKQRAPTLLYNSAHAEPFPVLAASVTLSSSSGLPDSVEGKLTITGVGQVALGHWLGSDWTTPGTTRRIALGFAASADTVYDYTLEAATMSPAGRYGNSVTGKLIVVNRSANGFGAGWWLAGIERVKTLADGSRLWIGGDGSARVYQVTTDPNAWVAQALNRPDTLKKVAGGQYYRLLSGGTKVWFSAAGWHDSTVNRLGHRTSFGYNSAPTNRLLTSITLPSQGGGQSYTFAYDSSAPPSRVVTVTAPGARVTKLWLTSLRVDSIRDPDNTIVRFTYEDASSRRIASRTDRRGTVTSYNYDVAKKLWRVHTAMQPDSIRLGFYAIERRSFFTASPRTAIDTASAYTVFYGPRQYATRASDQLNQDTWFYVDRFGAVRRLRTSLSQWTTVRREDGQWAALPTDVVDASNFETRAGYDYHGNIIRSVAVNPLGTGLDAVTRYHWDPLWDAVDSIVTPMGVTTTMFYDGQNGNRLWQQVGSDAARRVSFRYGNAQKLLSSTVLPQTPADSIIYNAQWNLAATRTPRGFWTSYYKDALGRDTLVVTPVDSTDKLQGGAADTARLRQRTVFTIADRDSITEAIAPYTLERVRVDNRFDVEGNPLSLARVSIPDPPAIGTIATQWRYDRANRKVAEVAPDGNVDSTDYDPAGNVVNAVTRRKDPTSGVRLTIPMTYDAVNRMLTRVLPAVTYQSRPTGFTNSYPSDYWTALPYVAYAIPADTNTFTYDPLGRVLTADNADAKVKRTYYPGGLLQTDSLRIQTVPRNDWNSHKYGLRNTYDLNGRRTVLAVPHQLGIGNDTTIVHTYDPQIGLLQTLTDLQRDTFALGYNFLGQLSSVTYPGSYSEGFRYDADGQVAADTVWNNGSSAYPRIQSAPLVRAMRLYYEARSKLLLSGDLIQLKDTVVATYTGLGNLKTTVLIQHGCNGCELLPTDRQKTTEIYTQDALANHTLNSVADTLFQTGGYSAPAPTSDVLQYLPGTGRLTTLSPVNMPTRTFSYDSAGNVIFESAMDLVNARASSERAAFFAADGSLRMIDSRSAQNSHPLQGETQRYAVEEYRYDALRRRVWLRARKWCDDPYMHWYNTTECRLGLIRRTVWDGNQEIAEIQMPWALEGVTIGGLHDTTQTPTWWENDTSPVSLALLQSSEVADPNPSFGHVIYAGRQGVDQPIAVTRVNYVSGMDWKLRTTYPSPQVHARFTIVPFWDARGNAPVGVFSTGVQALCDGPAPTQACVAMRWPWLWTSADRQRSIYGDYWQGTLLESKRDKSGFGFMRNRYYDPLTGRFTQEDPIGLAGGLNAYAFAAGDPINYGDPFGLHPCEKAGYQDHDDYDVVATPANLPPVITTHHVDCSAQRKALVMRAVEEGTPPPDFAFPEIEPFPPGYDASYAVAKDLMTIFDLACVGAGGGRLVGGALPSVKTLALFNPISIGTGGFCFGWGTTRMAQRSP